MQNPPAYQQIQPQFPDHEHLKCPRCDSTNTKFCYYNNYNLSQPRHFCKNCRRYWTKGGALRNIPVGGGSRKNTKRASKPKHASTSSSSSSPLSSSTARAVPIPESSAGYGLPAPAAVDRDRRMVDFGGSFSSLLTSNGRFGNSLPEGLNPHGTEVRLVENFSNSETNAVGNPPQIELQNTDNSESFLGVQNGSGDSSCWGGANGWPDLSIYTPGSTFQ
ncbi:hypothetical protein U1Q18_043139 [Sarracenia purpurea var. burkii]